MQYNNYMSKMSVNNREYSFYDVKKFIQEQGGDFAKTPYSIRVLLENIIRNGDEVNFSFDYAKTIAQAYGKGDVLSIPYKPTRVILQDLTGVPAVVDLASLREGMKVANKDPKKITPEIQVDLVIDHSVQMDCAGTNDALEKNVDIEFKRNKERYTFFKWAQNNLDNFNIIPPGVGIIHQVNLEYIADIVMEKNGMLYPDTVYGTDSHTTMINALAVLGWGVGGIEAEAIMLGQQSYFPMPEVVGVELKGELNPSVSATDLTLNIVRVLREHGVVGKFVEYFGEGVKNLTLEDRATISNMAPEYGATCGFFALDNKSFDYLKMTGRSAEKLELIKKYGETLGLIYDDSSKPVYNAVITVDLSTIKPSLSGPKRPQDTVYLEDMKSTFINAVSEKSNKGYGLSTEELNKTVECEKYGTLKTGDITVASITSCTNTSNPYVLIGAGILAKKAVEMGLSVPSYVKTSLAPGSKVVSAYLNKAGLQPYLDQLGFQVAGYGCATCIGNSGPLAPEIEKALKDSELLTCSVLSGNRNFEARIHQLIKGNYLASPIYVVAYAIAGTVLKDLTKEPIAISKDGKEVFLKDILPSKSEIESIMREVLTSELFQNEYKNVYVNEKWNEIPTITGDTFSWDDNSTYVKNPPFFTNMKETLTEIKPLKDVRILAILGDSITTDHISPAGSITPTSVAGTYLQGLGVSLADLNTFGSRRGNHEVMMRGTLANSRLSNKLANGKIGSYTTLWQNDNPITTIFDASVEYRKAKTPLTILAGHDYGMGSSRDWAAKGVQLLGVTMVIAQSYERIHRSNLALMGVLPLQFMDGESAETIGLTGEEVISLNITDSVKTGEILTVTATLGQTVKEFKVVLRIDNEIEFDYYKNHGILQMALNKKINS